MLIPTQEKKKPRKSRSGMKLSLNIRLLWRNYPINMAEMNQSWSSVRRDPSGSEPWMTMTVKVTTRRQSSEPMPGSELDAAL